jgi:hypothetical protein
MRVTHKGRSGIMKETESEMEIKTRKTKRQIGYRLNQREALRTSRTVLVRSIYGSIYGAMCGSVCGSCAVH